MIQGDDIGILIHQDKLVERVGHIARGDVGHAGKGVGNLHVRLPDGEGQVGLVIEAVTGGIHRMAGVDVQVAAVFVHAQGAGFKVDGGVGPAQAGLPQTLPVPGILHHPDRLSIVVLRGVLLAEDEEVAVFPGEEPAPEGQLKGDGLGSQQLEAAVVGLHHNLLWPDDFDGAVALVDLPACVMLHPHQVFPVLIRSHSKAQCSRYRPA